MKTDFFLFFWPPAPYIVNIIFVGFALAFFIQKRGKAFSWFPAIPILFVLFAINDLYNIPFFAHLDATFTIHNKEVAELLGTTENEPLIEFIMANVSDFTGWLVEACLALLFALFLTKGPASKQIKAEEK